MIDWGAVEQAGIAAATEAMERGALRVMARAKELAPYRRVSAEQSAGVRSRIKRASEIEADRGLRERIGLGPESRTARIVTRRPPQLPGARDVFTRRGRYEIKTRLIEQHLRDRIYAERATLDDRIIRARIISPAPYSKFLEFGTGHTPAHPFMRPAAHETRDPLKADVARSVSGAVRSRMSGRIEVTIPLKVHGV